MVSNGAVLFTTAGLLQLTPFVLFFVFSSLVLLNFNGAIYIKLVCVAYKQLFSCVSYQYMKEMAP